MKYVPRSEAKKIAGCAATYLHLSSCPSTCPLARGGGCYTDETRIRRVNTFHTDYGSMGEVQAEAETLRRVDPIPRDLRLHVSGDSSFPSVTEELSKAVEVYKKKSRGAVWTYTHAWATVPREAWGAIRVRASLEHPDQKSKARRNGYKSFAIISPVRIPGSFICPGTLCVLCRVCLDTGADVTMIPHGPVRKLKTTLARITLERKTL